MSKQIPISPEDLINEFLDMVETKANWLLMNSTDVDAMYSHLSSALDQIMSYPAFTERARQLSQYLDKLYWGDPFVDYNEEV